MAEGIVIVGQQVRPLRQLADEIPTRDDPVPTMIFTPHHGTLGPKLVAERGKTRFVGRRVLVKVNDYSIFCGHLTLFYLRRSWRSYRVGGEATVTVQSVKSTK
jgi:hypothetical protein